jgi:Sulfatase
LKLNGYATAQFGKCHEVPVWETSPLGPFDSWPSGGGGFEYFYGFIGGETNQYYPAIYEGTIPVEPDKTPEEDYHLTEDMTDKAIKWIRQEKALMGDKPFFVYFARCATHAPHHVPTEWSAKYRGKFDQGWDKLREESQLLFGTHQVRMEFADDGGGLGKGGTVALFIDGERTGEGRVEGTVPMAFSADETCDIGSDTASPVSDDYTTEGSRFTGTIEWVQIDIDEAAEDLDHLISPEDRLQIAMSRQ